MFLSLKDECMKDRRHSYMVDGWVGMHSWWEEDGRVVVPKKDLQVSKIVNGTNAGGRKSVENALAYMRDNLMLMEDEDDSLWKVAVVEKPFWKLGRSTLENMLTHVSGRQFRTYMACARVWTVSGYRGCEAMTSLGQLAKVMGMTDCPNNTRRIGEDLQALKECGMVTTSKMGRMTRIDYVSQGWKGAAKHAVGTH